jgi:hypothetical protein
LDAKQKVFEAITNKREVPVYKICIYHDGEWVEQLYQKQIDIVAWKSLTVNEKPASIPNSPFIQCSGDKRIPRDSLYVRRAIGTSLSVINNGFKARGTILTKYAGQTEFVLGRVNRMLSAAYAGAGVVEDDSHKISLQAIIRIPPENCNVIDGKVGP